MSDVSGIPSMGFGGGGYFGGSAALGQPAMSAAQINASMWGNYSPQQAQATQASIYGPMGFGGQTAAYSALGAAYGRQVPQSSPAAVAAAGGGGQADRLRALYPGAFSGGGIGSDAARSPNQGRLSGVFDQSMYAPTTNSMGDYFTRLTGGQQANPVTSSPGYPYHSPSSYAPAVTSAPTMPSSMRLLGYDPATSGQWAPQTPPQFQARFGMGFPNAGTPSQYAPGAQMPPSFSQPFSADHPSGALPLGAFGMNPNPGS